MKTLACLAALCLSGCCLAPQTIRTELEHVSHATQHIGSDRTHMGAELVAVVARWRKGGAYLDVSEGYNVTPADDHLCIGGICGPREVFTAAVGYEWSVR